jgi:4-amino-4-deoxy-L-arabinose transferase-like glycosyltransferase
MEVAREMVAMKDYLVPHLNGLVYSEKPPFFFWLAAGLWKAGLGYNATRIVSVIAVFGTLSLIYLLGRHLMNRRAGLLGAAVALTTVFLIEFSQEGALDPLLMFLETGALTAGLLAFNDRGRRQKFLWIGCYIFMGLATLTKGPVGIITPGLILLAFGLLNHRKIRAGGVNHIWGTLALVLVIAGWIVPAVIQGGQEYAHTILIKQNFGRAVGSWSHRNPVYYYLNELPWRLFPWSLFLPTALVAGILAWKRSGEDTPLLAMLWVVIPVIFFSLMSGKRGRYILPVVPGLGLLCAWYFAGRKNWSERYPKIDRWLFRAGFALLGLAALGLMITLLIVYFDLPLLHLSQEDQVVIGELILTQLTWGYLLAVLVMLAIPVGTALAGLLSNDDKVFGKLVLLISTVMFLSVSYNLFFQKTMNDVKSGRHFCTVLRQKAGPRDNVFLLGDDYSGTYNLYAGRTRMPILQDARELKKRLNQPGNWVIADSERLEEFLTPEEANFYGEYRERIGHRIVVLLQSEAPSPE